MGKHPSEVRRNERMRETRRDLEMNAGNLEGRKKAKGSQTIMPIHMGNLEGRKNRKGRSTQGILREERMSEANSGRSAKNQARTSRGRYEDEILERVRAPIFETPEEEADPRSVTSASMKDEGVKYSSPEERKPQGQRRRKCRTNILETNFSDRDSLDDLNMRRGLGDGKISFKNECLVVSSVPFTRTVDHDSPPGLDDNKWSAYLNNAVRLKSRSELMITADMTGTQYFDYDRPFPNVFKGRVRNIEEDPRLASVSLDVIDPENGLIYAFSITNGMIYAVYGMRPTKFLTNEIPEDIRDERESTARIQRRAQRSGVYESSHGNAGHMIRDRRSEELSPDFLNFVPVLSRCRRDDFHRLSISLKPPLRASWLIDGEEVFTVPISGCRLDERYRVLDNGVVSFPLFPKVVIIGFGTRTHLDLTIPNDYARQYVQGSYRGRSALVRLRDEYYHHVYASIRGNLKPVDRDFFAVNRADEIKIEKGRGVKLFDQGAVLRIRSIDIVRYLLEEIGERPLQLIETPERKRPDENEPPKQDECQKDAENPQKTEDEGAERNQNEAPEQANPETNAEEVLESEDEQIHSEEKQSEQIYTENLEEPQSEESASCEEDWLKEDLVPMN